ncbi:hypothetical protein [Streptomyces yaizuensis]|uniref:Uncharacterized protein n=1 Tax=Streptomyces yaizuensis TaxID=2989713 RepID=A0AA86IVJ4_9ACTN|nr:hypothetical protein [Streptomyces sp. YSPA8]BDT39644.1 hypothetical protein SYYSPA8_37630 [Streptomyces sp. YSPA8]
MRGDRRQIQTAVLGSVDSDEPLMLPLEAIELDVFRRRHDGDTFWCGLLLGGCGLQLTTKLYTDRVCHFAHHRGPEGHLHVCGRRARGVSSADHLYVKSAASAWLRERGMPAGFEFAQPDGAPIGSVVDIQMERRGLRVHLDQAVAPVWDEEREPVLGVSVPVDRDTLIRRWYVHRIRLDSEGTARVVRIGTEAFARPTEWFGLEDCEVTERGLTTPAVQRIVASHSAPAPRWTPGKAKKEPTVNAQARALLSQLDDARSLGLVLAATRLCSEIAALPEVDREAQERLDAALKTTKGWLEEQVELRRSLYAQLDQAVMAQDTQQVRTLYAHVNAKAAHDRTEEEDAIVSRAADHFADQARATHESILAKVTAERAAADAITRVGNILKSLNQGRYRNMRDQVETLVRYGEVAGDRVTVQQGRQIEIWKQRAGLSPGEEPTEPLDDDGTQQLKRKRPLYRQVARRHWIKRSCPRCLAGRGADCVIADGTGNGELRYVPHDERLQPILDQRKARLPRRK